MRKKILCFIVTFTSVFVVGAIVLLVYAELLKRTTTVASEQAESVQTNVKPMEEATEKMAEKGLKQAAEDSLEEEGEGFGRDITLVFGGDICFNDGYTNMYAFSNRGGTIDRCISSELLDEMRQADICMVNNEFPYSDRGTPLTEKAFTFRSKPENVEILREMGVDVVSLANNHAYDYGEEALLDTFFALENVGVDYVGAGRNLGEASKGVFWAIEGTTIGILAVTQIERVDNPDTKGATEDSSGVLRCFSEKELYYFLELVMETKKKCDVLIVYIHWGTENTDEPDWAQPYQAELISKAGADLIVGAHPHCLQGVDCVNDVPVIYSLGNYWFNSKTMDTALLQVTLQEKKIKSIRMIPALQSDCRTILLEGEEKQRVLEHLQTLSPNVQIDADGFVK